MMADDVITLDVERVRELLESHDRFLAALRDLVEDKLAEERREGLSLVKGEDDG